MWVERPSSVLWERVALEVFPRAHGCRRSSRGSPRRRTFRSSRGRLARERRCCDHWPTRIGRDPTRGFPRQPSRLRSIDCGGGSPADAGCSGSPRRRRKTMSGRGCVDEARRRPVDFRVDPTFGCFHDGEQPSVIVRAHRPGSSGSLAVPCARDARRAQRVTEHSLGGPERCRARYGARAARRFVRAGSLPGDVDTEALGRATTGFWMFDADLFASGDALTFDGDTLRRGGRAEPVVGTTTMSATVHRDFLFEPNAAVWDDAFGEIASLGMNAIRTGLWSGWRKITRRPERRRRKFPAGAGGVLSDRTQAPVARHLQPVCVRAGRLRERRSVLRSPCARRAAGAAVGVRPPDVARARVHLGPYQRAVIRVAAPSLVAAARPLDSRAAAHSWNGSRRATNPPRTPPAPPGRTSCDAAGDCGPMRGSTFRPTTTSGTPGS